MEKPIHESQTTVLLRHELPDGTWHFDWLIPPPAPAPTPARASTQPSMREIAALEPALITFRAAGRIDELNDGQHLDLVRLADHRAMYVDYEGPVSGGRGSVRRVRRGRVERAGSTGHDETATCELCVCWDQEDGSISRQRLRLGQVDSTRWSVICEGKPAVRSSSMM